jgi:hypothetical protein
MLAENDGWPIHVRDVLARAYRGQPRVNGHYVAVWRARRKFAVPLRRGLLGPNAKLLKQIRGEYTDATCTRHEEKSAKKSDR